MPTVKSDLAKVARFTDPGCARPLMYAVVQLHIIE
jgi:hypothetical protein